MITPDLSRAGRKHRALALVLTISALTAGAATGCGAPPCPPYSHDECRDLNADGSCPTADKIRQETQDSIVVEGTVAVTSGPRVEHGLCCYTIQITPDKC